ncbi:SIR2 family protein [Pseudoduganella sp. FT26W]|uniref:SIR2 family protein n=1 Tax=Duganella aquatilis TaxID=2666082 RepID=A0A844D3W9_9BURK|nr:SIR2 family protein [Duganella aquatilis]MRW87533.1 SIR2 family protein [Duganella aquatilis]
MPTAASISVRETLALFDTQFSGLSKGTAQGEYAFWLGSGISRERVVGLDGVLATLIEFLQKKVTPVPACGYRAALDKIISMAAPSAAEQAQIDYAQPATSWPCFKDLLKRLWNQYSAVLSVEIPGEKLDFLLWVGLDFPKTFSAQQPDAEHLAIGMLALEGAVSELATANWDGLLEAAIQELGYDKTFYQIVVTGAEVRNPAAAANLYKFHGCALRAIDNEVEYRPLLVARTAQITGWKSNATFKITRDQLSALVQRRKTLMIGMSAQDENIKHLFASMNEVKGWKWTDKPSPIVFSAQELGDDQKNVLIGAYGEAEYEAHRDEICEAARFQAYAKPLLLGLLLHVLTAKLEILASVAPAPNLDLPSRAAIADGLKILRNRIAEAGNADRLALVRSIAANLARARHQLQNGSSDVGVQPYFPIDTEPAHRLANKLALKSSGQQEAAVALGLIGMEEQATNWTCSVDDPSLPTTGALRLTSTNATARVFFAANDATVTSLLDTGAFDETDSDAVIVCSGKISGRQQRNPSATMRTGTLGPRYIAFGPLLNSADDLAKLRDQFRGELGL